MEKAYFKKFKNKSQRYRWSIKIQNITFWLRKLLYTLKPVKNGINLQCKRKILKAVFSKHSE